MDLRGYEKENVETRGRYGLCVRSAVEEEFEVGLWNPEML